MNRKIRWLSLILPNACIVLYEPWAEVGAAGVVLSVLFLVVVWFVVEACNFARKTPAVLIVFSQFTYLRQYELPILKILTAVWLCLFLFLLHYYATSNESLGTSISNNWNEIRASNPFAGLISRFPPFLLIITGAFVGLSFDSSKNGEAHGI